MKTVHWRFSYNNGLTEEINVIIINNNSKSLNVTQISTESFANKFML